MSLPEGIVTDIKRDEGWRPSAYQDHLGYWTIGYGFLIDARRNGELPQMIADAWLKDELQTRWHALSVLFPWLAEQPEDVKRALLNMAYQLGISGLQRFRKMLTALEAGDRNRAADEALNSVWATQTPERAKRVAALLRG